MTNSNLSALSLAAIACCIVFQTCFTLGGSPVIQQVKIVNASEMRSDAIRITNPEVRIANPYALKSDCICH